MPQGHPGPEAWEGDMYNHDGQDLFVIDGHMHFWDANPENWKNKYGESWIKCFHAFHSGHTSSAGLRRCGRSTNFVDTMKRRWPTICSEMAMSTWPSSTRPICMSSIRMASTPTFKTTSSK